MDNKKWLTEFINTESDQKVGFLIGLILQELSKQSSEQTTNSNKNLNRTGFTAFDTNSGTEDAKSFQRHGTLAGFRLERWIRVEKSGYPRIVKYHDQMNREDLESRLVECAPLSTEADILADARKEYARVRGLFKSGSDCEPRKFDELVKARVGENPTPTKFVLVAKSINAPCHRCAGTGRFVSKAVNGQPRDTGAMCFRCEGKGYQTIADARRNWGHDRFGRKEYL